MWLVLVIKKLLFFREYADERTQLFFVLFDELIGPRHCARRRKESSGSVIVVEEGCSTLAVSSGR